MNFFSKQDILLLIYIISFLVIGSFELEKKTLEVFSTKKHQRNYQNINRNKKKKMKNALVVYYFQKFLFVVLIHLTSIYHYIN